MDAQHGSSSAEREGLVSCPVTQTGPYLLTWEIDGTALGPPVQYNGTAVGQQALPCIGLAGTPFNTGGFRQPLPTGVKLVNSYTLPAAAWLWFLSVDLVGRGGGAESLTGVVYQDAGGAPGDLVATTKTCVVKGRDTSDCNVMPFEPAVNVPAGTYWFGILTGGTSNIAAVQDGPAGIALWNKTRCRRRAIRSARPLAQGTDVAPGRLLAEPPSGASAPAPPRVSVPSGPGCHAIARDSGGARTEVREPHRRGDGAVLVRLDRIEVWSARAYVFQALPGGDARSVRQGIIGLFRDGRVVYMETSGLLPPPEGRPAGGAALRTSGPRFRPRGSSGRRRSSAPSAWAPAAS